MENKKQYQCPTCMKEFDASSDAPRMFCLYCGQEINKDQDQVIAKKDLLSWLKDYVKETDPDKRLIILKNEKEFSEEARLLEVLWQERFKRAKIKGLNWADTWLGYLQVLMTYRNEKMNRSQKKKIEKVYKKWFLTDSIQKKLATALPNPGEVTLSDSWSKDESSFYLLYIELLSLTYLYVHLCMNDKNYGAILLGIGRRSDKSIASKISEDLVELQLNILNPLSDEIPMNKLLIKALQDGYRMYFDDKFELS